MSKEGKGKGKEGVYRFINISPLVIKKRTRKADYPKKQYKKLKSGVACYDSNRNK